MDIPFRLDKREKKEKKKGFYINVKDEELWSEVIIICSSDFHLHGSAEEVGVQSDHLFGGSTYAVCLPANKTVGINEPFVRE